MSSGAKRPDYMTQEMWRALPKSIGPGFKIGFKSGDKTQNGGEYTPGERFTVGFYSDQVIFVAGDTRC